MVQHKLIGIDHKYGSRTQVLCQAIKEHPNFSYRPDFNLLSIMKSLKKFQGLPYPPCAMSQPQGKSNYNSQSKYLKYRRKTIRTLFQTSERFGFNNDTVHHAISLFDGTLSRHMTTK